MHDEEESFGYPQPDRPFNHRFIGGFFLTMASTAGEVAGVIAESPSVEIASAIGIASGGLMMVQGYRRSR